MSEISISIERQAAGPFSPERATVSGTCADGRFSVSVEGPHWSFGEMRPATVNWSGCGSRSPEAAALYAALVSAAAAIAPTMQPSAKDEEMAR